MSSNMKIRRSDMHWADPHKELRIFTSHRHPKAGPVDKVDPAHPLVEENERPITEEQLADYEANGIHTPILGIKNGDSMIEVIVGRRRTRGARIVNERRAEKNKTLPKADRLPMLEVPVILKRGTAVELAGLMMSENMNRADYSPIQTARAFHRYIEMGATEKMCAERAGKKLFYVRSHLKLLDLSPEMQAAVDDGRVGVTPAGELSSKTKEEQTAMVKALPEGKKITARDATRAVKQSRGDTREAPSAKDVKRTVALLNGPRGGMSERERTIVTQTIQWLRTGEKPTIFTLPE